MNVNNLQDLYTDYLLICLGQSTATGLSALMSNYISHDKITRMLSSGTFNSKTLWQKVKPICHEIQSSEAVLIFDDSIEEKKYTDRSELVNWYPIAIGFDHTVGRSVKGVNFMTALYHSKDMSVPVGVDPIAIGFVKKDKGVIDKKGKLRDKSKKSKNEMYREMLYQACYNVHFKYVGSNLRYS